VTAPWTEWSERGRSFVSTGSCAINIEARAELDAVRRAFVSGLRTALPGGDGIDDETYINRFHEFADPTKLNDVRVRVGREQGSSEDVRRGVFRCVAKDLAELIGVEIAMQRHVNLVLHMPGDTTNLLYLHTDAWSGCSPYEVIAWIPLVDVFGTKSMYVCPRAKGQRHLEALRGGLELPSAEALFARVEPDVEPVTLKYGQALLFSPTLLHGARQNTTNETRAILNVRFKALFSPYGTKTLGETFLPVSYLPASEIGLSYEADFGMVRG
jgi:sporadic carbohydrate cluster 2OG-Fe(II) oxygenase